MNDQIKDGGSAFPVSFAIASSRGRAHDVLPSGGMTLRDYFAAKAMQGAMAAYAGPHNGFPGYAELARDSYKQADAMLAARGDA
jgi:hypothetical protein